MQDEDREITASDGMWQADGDVGVMVGGLGVRWGRVGGLLGEQWQLFWVGGGVRGHAANVILITAATVGVLHCARARCRSFSRRN